TTWRVEASTSRASVAASTSSRLLTRTSSSRRAGERGRLPAWVVRIRCSLRCIVVVLRGRREAPAPDDLDLLERRRTAVAHARPPARPAAQAGEDGADHARLERRLPFVQPRLLLELVVLQQRSGDPGLERKAQYERLFASVHGAS